MHRPALPLLLAGLLAAAPACADTPAKAHLCTGCHGAHGEKAAPGQVAIGGRPAAALVAAMQDYQHLRRLNPAMQLLILAMSDRDIDEVAAYFAQGGPDQAR